MNPDLSHELIRVHALHALAYCERLFYLEEVEEIRVVDAAMYAGLRLHVDLEGEGEKVELALSSQQLGIYGKVDALRRRDGSFLVYEHKRGRPAPGKNGPEAWQADRIQVGAYALLVEERYPGVPIECRVRYHHPAATVTLALDAELRAQVLAAIQRANVLRDVTQRPPVTSDERKCARCSLAPACLPEEERSGGAEAPLPRLFPEDEVRQVIHISEPGSRVGRAGEQLVMSRQDGPETQLPIKTLAAVVIHGASQISSQALALCVINDVGVHWFTGGGCYL